jgi:hypothetical protein
MIWAMALPFFAAGLAPDREPGAPWVRFSGPGKQPVYLDPGSLHEEGGEKVVRLLDTAETAATRDVWIDISFKCETRRAWIIRLTVVEGGKAGEVTSFAEADRNPMKLDDPFGQRLLGFVCEGKPLA